MPIKVYPGGSTRTVKNVYVYVGGQRRKVKTAYAYPNGQRRVIYRDTPPAVLTATLGAVLDFGVIGFRGGLEGTLVPLLSFRGGYCDKLYTKDEDGKLTYEMIGFAADPGKARFSTLNVDAGSGIFVTSASTYTYSAGVATWTWTTAYRFANGSNYAIQLQGYTP